MHYNKRGRAANHPVIRNQFTKWHTKGRFVADLIYNKYMSNKTSNMINIELTVEEARAYADALNRATDNPFIQDDDDCSPLFTLLGVIEAEIDTVLDPIK